MKPFAPLVALLAAITPAMPVVAQVGLSIQIGQPNVYGGPFSPASTAATNLSYGTAVLLPKAQVSCL